MIEPLGVIVNVLVPGLPVTIIPEAPMTLIFCMASPGTGPPVLPVRKDRLPDGEELTSVRSNLSVNGLNLNGIKPPTGPMFLTQNVRFYDNEDIIKWFYPIL